MMWIWLVDPRHHRIQPRTRHHRWLGHHRRAPTGDLKACHALYCRWPPSCAHGMELPWPSGTLPPSGFWRRHRQSSQRIRVQHHCMLDPARAPSASQVCSLVPSWAAHSGSCRSSLRRLPLCSDACKVNRMVGKWALGFHPRHQSVLFLRISLSAVETYVALGEEGVRETSHFRRVELIITGWTSLR
jgi:hypothetical protein